MSGPEQKLQNDIRNALAGECILFRANTGTGWTSSLPPVKVVHIRAVSLRPGDVLLRDARPFSTGLPPGFSDTFGSVQTIITPDMVGEKFALSLFGEVKTKTGRVSDKQAAFLHAMTNYGSRAGVWRSVEDALRMVRGVKEG